MKCSIAPEILFNDTLIPSSLFKEALVFANNLTNDQLKNIGLTEESKSENRRLFATEIFRLSQNSEMSITEYNTIGEPTLNNIFEIIKRSNHPYSKVMSNDIKLLNVDRKVNFNNQLGTTFEDADLTYYNKILTSLYMLNMDELNKLKLGSYKMVDGERIRINIKAELLNLLDARIQEIRSNLATPEKDLEYARFREDYMKVDSIIWNSFTRYMKTRYGLITNNSEVKLTDNNGETEVAQDEERSALKPQWDDLRQSTINRVDTVSNVTKLEIAKLIANVADGSTHNDSMYIPEPYEINAIWNQLLSAHRFDTTPGAIEKTLVRLAQSDPIFFSILEKFNMARTRTKGSANAQAFVSGYSGSVPLALIEVSKLQLKRNVVNQFNVNRDSFAEKVIFDKFQTDIILNIKSKEFNTAIATINGISNIKTISRKLAQIGLDVPERAIQDYLDMNTESSNQGFKQSDINELISDLVMDINFVIEDMNLYIANPKLIKDELASNEKGCLLRIAQIASLNFNSNTSLSYLDVNGALNWTPEFDSLLTRTFRGLVKFGKVDKTEVGHVFEPYTKDASFENENFLWHNPKINKGYGIFNYTIKETKMEDGSIKSTKVIQSVNETFVKKLSLFKLNGIESNNTGTLYANIESTNWLFTQFAHALLGQFIMPTSDSARSYGISIPIIPVTDLFSGETINEDHGIFNALNNVVLQDIDSYFISKTKVFNEDNTPKTEEELTKLQDIKDYKIGNNLESIAIINGVPTGRAFKFLNLTYVKNGKAYSFANYIMEAKGIAESEILNLSKADMISMSKGFTQDYIKNIVDASLKVLEPIKNDLMAKTTTVKRNTLFTEVREGDSMMNQKEYAPKDGETSESIERNKKLTRQANEVAYRNSVAETVLNTTINSVTMNNLFLGKLNEYKTVIDWNKRIGQTIKNGYHATVQPKNDYKNILIVQDIQSKSNMLDLLRNDLTDTTIKALDQTADVTDGMSIITDVEYKRQMEAIGRFDEVAPIYYKLQTNQPVDTSEYHKFIQQLKLFGTNRTMRNGQVISMQLKDSTHVIFARTVRGSEFSKVYDYLVKHSIGQMSFASAVKVSGVKPTTMADVINGTIKNVDDHILNVKLSDLVVQQDSQDHIVDEVNKLGTQLAKRLLEGINYKEALYNLNGKQHTGAEIAKVFNDLMGSNFEEAGHDLLRELGALDGRNLKMDANGNLDINKDLLQQIMEKYIKSDTDNYNNLMAITKGLDGESNIPFSSPIIYNNFVSVLLAKITKDVIDFKVPGMHMPIIPNILTNPSIGSYDQFLKLHGDERNTTIDNYLKTSWITYDDQFIEEVKLGGTINEEGVFIPNKGTFNGKPIIGRPDFKLRAEHGYDKTTGDLLYPADVILNPWHMDFYKNIIQTREVEYVENGITKVEYQKFVDINSIPEDARKMLAIRIPTEGKQSTVILKVVGFLNTGSSQAVFPFTLMTRTGWDFDIDTVYVQYKTVEYVNGEFQTVKFNDEPTDKDLLQYVNKVYSEQILDIESGFGNSAEDINLLDLDLIDNYSAVINDIKTSEFGNLHDIITDLRKAFMRVQDQTSIKPSDETIKIIYNSVNKLGIITSNIENISKNVAQYNKLDKRFNELYDHISQSQDINESRTAQDYIDYQVMGKQLKTVFTNIKDAITKVNSELSAIKETTVDSPMLTKLSNEFNYLAGNVLNKEEVNAIAGVFDTVNEYVNKFAESKRTEFEALDANLRNSKEARANKLLDVFISILGNKEHANEVNKPNAYDNIQKSFKWVNNEYGKSVDQLNPNNLIDQVTLNNLNMAVRKLKSFSVSWDNAMANIGFLNGKLSQGITKVFDKGTLPNVTKNDLINLFGENNIKLYNESDKEVKLKRASQDISNYKVRISDTNLNNNLTGTGTDVSGAKISVQASEVTANILDAVKHLMGFNLNTDTHGVFRLLSSGVATNFDGKIWNRFDNASLFIHQPSIIDAVEQLNKLRTTNPNYRLDVGLEEARNNIKLAIYDIFATEFATDPSLMEYRKSIEDYKTMPFWMRKSKQGVPDKAIIQLRNKFPALKKYSTKGDGYIFTNAELKSFIENRNKQADYTQEQALEYQLQQLNIILQFKTLNVIAGKISNLNHTFKTEDSVGPDFNKVASRSIAIADAWMTIDSFKDQLDKSIGISINDKLKYIQEFELTTNVKDRIAVINRLMAIATKPSLLESEIKNIEDETIADEITSADISPKPFMTINGRPLLETIFPGEFDTYLNKNEDGATTLKQSYKDSAYGNIEAKYEYGHYLASILFNKVFIQQNQIFKNAVNSILLNANFKVSHKLASVISSKLVNSFIDDSAIFEHVSTEEWERVLGVDTTLKSTVKIDGKDVNWTTVVAKNTITNEVFKEWLQLTTANKLHIIKQTGRYQEYYKNNKFRNAHVLSDLTVVDRNANRKGYRRIVYKNDGTKANIAINSFKDMYMSNNPYLANLSRDLILYTYKTTGLQFGFSLMKAIPIDIFSNNNLNNKVYDKFVEEAEYIDPARMIGEYSNTIKSLESLVNNNSEHIQLDRAKPYINMQMHSNKMFNPITPTADLVKWYKEHGKFTASFDRTASINIEHEGVTYPINIIIENRFRVSNSKYNKNQFVTYSTGGKFESLFRRIDIEQNAQSMTDIIVYTETNNLENNEWTETSLNPKNNKTNVPFTKVEAKIRALLAQHAFDDIINDFAKEAKYLLAINDNPLLGDYISTDYGDLIDREYEQIFDELGNSVEDTKDDTEENIEEPLIGPIAPEVLKVSFSKELITTNDSVTNTVKQLIANTGSVIFIGSESTFLGKTVKGNAPNYNFVDINTNAKTSAVSLLNNISNIPNIAILGDSTEDLKVTQSFANGWIADFIDTLTDNVGTIKEISTYGNKGIGYAVDRFNGRPKQKTYVNYSNELIYTRHDTSTKDYVDKYNTNLKTVVAGMLLVVNADKTFDRRPIKSDSTKVIASISTQFARQGLIKSLEEGDLNRLKAVLEMMAGNSTSPGSVKGILNIVNDIYKSIKDTRFETIFEDKVRLREINEGLALALQLIDSLDMYREFQLFDKSIMYEHTTDANGKIVYSVEDEKDFADNFKPINDLMSRLINDGTRANVIKSQIKGLAQDLMMTASTRYSKNPQMLNEFSQFKQQLIKNNFNNDDIIIDIDRDSQEYKDAVKFIFEGSKDISWAQAKLDSPFDTGVPFVDLVMKQYVYAKADNIKLANQQVDLFTKILNKYGYTGLDRDARIAKFSKFITATGSLIANYNTDDFMLTWRNLKLELRTILANEIGNPNDKHHSSEWYAYHAAKDAAINKWAVENTDFAKTGKRAILDAKESQDVNDQLIGMNTRARQQWLMANNIYEFVEHGKNDNTYIRVTPNDKYINADYQKLSEEDKEFIKEITTIFAKVVKDVKPEYLLKDTFLPFVSSVEVTNMLKGMFGISSIKTVNEYSKINGDTGYYLEAQTMKRPEYYPIYKHSDKLTNQTAEEYIATTLEDVNRRYKQFKFKALGADYVFNTMADIDAYNVEAKNRNMVEAARNMNRDPEEMVESFIHELYSIKAVNEFSDYYDIATYMFRHDLQLSEETLAGKTRLDKTLSAITGEYSVKTSSAKGSKLEGPFERALPLLYGVPRITNGWQQSLNVANRVGSMTFMWGNYLGGIKNVAKGLTDILSEGHANQYVDKAALGWALTHYPMVELLNAVNPEFEKEHHTDLRLAIIQHFDGIFQDSRDGRTQISGSEALVRGLSGMDNLMYAPNNLGEHYMQFSMLLAMTKSHRVANGKIISLGDITDSEQEEIAKSVLSTKQLIEFEQFVEKRSKLKTTQDQANTDLTDFMQLISKDITSDKRNKYIKLMEASKANIKSKFESLPTLYDSLEIVEGRMVAKSDSNIKDDELSDFGQRVMKVNQDMHGIYNTIDRMALQDSMIGELFLQFRKWMRPNFRRYFGRVFNESRFSEGKGSYEEGSYTPIFKILTHPYREYKYNKEANKGMNAITNLFTGYLHILRTAKFYYNTMPAFEQAAVRRFAAHVVSIIGFGLALALTGKMKDDDDEKQNAALATTVYELNAIYMELIEPVPAYGWWGSVKMARQQSMVSEKILVDVAKMINYGILEAAPDGLVNQDKLVYDRGVYKDRRKFEVQASKVIPIIRQIHKQQYIPNYTAFYKMYNPFL